VFNFQNILCRNRVPEQFQDALFNLICSDCEKYVFIVKKDTLTGFDLATHSSSLGGVDDTTMYSMPAKKYALTN
jgi:hypothetical protein